MEFAEYAPYLGDKTDCHFCGERTRLSHWGDRGIFRLERCEQCGLVFINPRLNATGLGRFYATYFANRSEDREMSRKREEMYRLESAFLLDHVQWHRRMLDIGCGGGHFLAAFPDRFLKIATEIDSVAAAYASRHYGFKCYVGDFQDLEIEEAPLDVIMLRGVIEHFTNPGTVLEKAAALLAPGGFLFISSTPNLDSVCAEVFRGMWNMVGPDHLYYFNERLLTHCLSKSGLTLVDRHHFYEETPYADLADDYLRIEEAIREMRNGGSPTRVSPPFWGNMLTLLYRKSKRPSDSL
ncbi:MAG: class I SAM-dependent methyltransferase [Pseudomonadota bacterium]